MKNPAKIEYACLALLELSKHWPNQEPLQIQAIAQRQGIPMKFLPHILIQLKQVGLVRSARGKNGGYLLLKSPEAIQLASVVEAFGGLNREGDFRNTGQNQIFVAIWNDVNQLIEQKLKSVNFAFIRERSEKQVIMYHI